MDRAKKILRTFLGIPITVLAFAFIGKVFIDNHKTILSSLSTLDMPLFLTGILFFSLFFLVKSYIWILILKNRGHTPPVRRTIFEYAVSEVKRYIPGSIFAVIGRMQAHAYSIPRKETIKGIGIEAALLIVSTSILSIPALLYFFPETRLYSTILVVLVPLLFVPTKTRSIILKYADALILFVFAWILYGLASIFITLAITPFAPGAFPVLLSLFIASWLGGYLFFIAPMGLGIREIILASSMSLFMPFALATSIAVMSRLGMILGELFFVGLTFIIARYKKPFIVTRDNLPFIMVAALSVLYSIVMSLFSMRKHDLFLTGRFDLGNMTQTVWNTSQGRIFTLTNPDGTEIVSRLAVHSDFILTFFAPLYWIWSSPKVLLISQSVILGLGGIFIYLLSQKITNDRRISLAFSISYFLNAWLHEQNLFDFHAVTIATTTLLAAFYFLLKKRYLLFGLFLTLSAITKENILLVISFFGVYLILKEKKYLNGSLLTILPIILFFYLSSSLIPNSRGEAHFVLDTYSYLGSSTGEIARNIFLKPYLLFDQIFNASTLRYIHEHLISTGYLAIFSPLYLLFTLPEAAIYLLTTNFGYRSNQYHFGAAILPFIFIASMHSINKIRNTFPYLKQYIFYFVLASGLLASYLYSPLPGMKQADHNLFRDKTVADQIKEYLLVIPQDASVSASNSLGAHLSHREYIYVAPFGFDRADYIALLNQPDELVQDVNTLYYDLIVEDKSINFYLFRKKVFSSCVYCTP